MTAPIRDVPIAPEIITRAESKERGLKRYFTGKPCKRGHIAERSTVNCSCLKCGSIDNVASKKRNRARVNAWSRQNYRKDIELSRVLARQRSLKYHHTQKGQLTIKKYRKEHREEKKRKAAQKYRANLAEFRKRNLHRYYNGPKNPKGEKSWLRKNQALLRSLRRLLWRPNLDHSRLLNEAPRR